jgi:hypothetical protein
LIWAPTGLGPHGLVVWDGLIGVESDQWVEHIQDVSLSL